MTVQNFECKIAKSQIGRYLSGEAMSAESLRQLEEHIAECASCKLTVVERRAALQGMLGGPEIPGGSPVVAEAAKSTPLETKRRTLGDRLVGAQAAVHVAAREEQPLLHVSPASEPALDRSAKPIDAKTFWKPLGLCALMAALLVGMRFVSGNPTSFFGPRVAVATPPPANSELSSASSISSGPSVVVPFEVVANNPAAVAEAFLAEPKVEPVQRGISGTAIAAPTPKPAQVLAAKPTSPLQPKHVFAHKGGKPKPRAVRRRRSRARPHPGNIVVYKPNGG